MIVAGSPGAVKLLVTLLDKDQIKPRVQDVIAQCFGIGQQDAVQFRIRRTAMYFLNRGSWADPMDV
jgi:hypothetical protein